MKRISFYKLAIGTRFWMWPESPYPFTKTGRNTYRHWDTCMVWEPSYPVEVWIA